MNLDERAQELLDLWSAGNSDQVIKQRIIAALKDAGGKPEASYECGVLDGFVVAASDCRTISNDAESKGVRAGARACELAIRSRLKWSP